MKWRWIEKIERKEGKEKEKNERKKKERERKWGIRKREEGKGK